MANKEHEKIYREEIASSIQEMKQKAAERHIHSLERYHYFSEKANAMNKYMIGGTVVSLTALATNLPVVKTLLSTFPRALPFCAVLGVFTGSSVLVTKCRVHLVDGVISQRGQYRRQAHGYSELEEKAHLLFLRSPLLPEDELTKNYTALSSKMRDLEFPRD
mmetsp:Transcript_28254/g.43766  ORF Transcript_28254/g.43766 Transcript_28254/m.43766 type:complete len:162 (-) Transcript_28254:322-807(-)